MMNFKTFLSLAGFVKYWVEDGEFVTILGFHIKKQTINGSKFDKNQNAIIFAEI